MANVAIRREKLHADLPPLMIASHPDSQPTGRRFDGALGVLVAWTNEEGSRFALLTCMPSGALSHDWHVFVDRRQWDAPA